MRGIWNLYCWRLKDFEVNQFDTNRFFMRKIFLPNWGDASLVGGVANLSAVYPWLYAIFPNGRLITGDKREVSLAEWIASYTPKSTEPPKLTKTDRGL